MAGSRSSVARVARPLRIASVSPLLARSDVWDITVPGEECFSLANGAVVHNSADAFRYLALVVKHTDAVMRRPTDRPKPAGVTLGQMFEDQERERSL
jgi:hypothetical protein